MLTALITDLVPVPFLYFAYALPPDGPWDRQAIYVDQMSSWFAIWASVVILVPQGLLAWLRILRLPWLVVPIACLLLAIGRYLSVR
ncbi:hypothetical protein [Saccharopolyspora taberi]|uniref:hypothetical protein n=1 Tax=Saccharopolyspora taberi TaxID=60895 RepID=UPI0031D37110